MQPQLTHCVPTPILVMPRCSARGQAPYSFLSCSLALSCLLLLLCLAFSPSAFAVALSQPPSSVRATPPPYAPSSPDYSAESVSSRASQSAFPSTRPEQRSDDQQRSDRARHDALFDSLRAAGALDSEGNPTSDAALAGLDAETRAYLDEAGDTLARVMQHEGRDVFHFKALVARAKQLLEARQFAEAAPLFKEATRFYFAKLREPYAAIASTRALGKTIEQRLAEQVARESAEKGEARGQSVAAQFRRKELDNLPHVHTALKEYAKTLSQNSRQQKKRRRGDKKARADNGAKGDPASPQQEL